MQGKNLVSLLAQRAEIQRRAATTRFGREQDLAKAQGRRALQQALIGGVTGFAGGAGRAAFRRLLPTRGTEEER